MGKPLLLIGPLPPEYGGARTSFHLFFNYLRATGTSNRNFDLPVLSFRGAEGTGRVDHIQTLWGVMKALYAIPSCGSIIIFGSRNFAFFYSLPFILLGRSLRRHCCIRFFGGRPMLALNGRNALIRWSVLTVFRLVSKISLETELGAKEFPLSLQEKILVIPGYRPRIDVQKQRGALYENIPVKFVYAGGITRKKGIDILIDAFADLRRSRAGKSDVELHLYGAGEGDIIENSQRCEGLHYHGRVDNVSLRKALPSYDVFVFPSVYDNEGHPGVLIEALMAGLPIIATDLPVIKETLTHNYNALIVRPGRREELLKAMETLSGSDIMRQRFSSAALESCRQFDADRILPKLAGAFGITF